MTIYFVMKKMRYFLSQEDLIVHIIGSSEIDEKSVDMWQILLHLIPSLKSLTITLVGRNLKESKSCNATYFVHHSNAMRKYKCFVKNHLSMSYHDYRRVKGFQKPSSVVGFNAVLLDYSNADENFPYNMVTCMELQKPLPRQNCPYILTFDTLYVSTLKEKLDKTEHIFYEQNPFASLRPYRDMNPNRICWSCKSVILFNKIDSYSVFVTLRNRCGLMLL